MFVLRVTSTGKTIAGKVYIFSFNVTNPSCDQAARTVSIRATPTPCYSWVTMYPKCVTPDLWEASCIDSRPMYVKQPSFIVQEIFQVMPFASKNNTFHLKLATNVDMLAGTIVTVTGLQGALLPSGEDVPLTGDTIFTSKARWRFEVLTFNLTARSTAGTNYSVSFVLQNPAICRDPASLLKIDANVACFGQANLVPRMNAALLLDSVPAGTARESAPLNIRCPAWLKLEIRQSTDLPCSDNIITVSLQARTSRSQVSMTLARSVVPSK